MDHKTMRHWLIKKLAQTLYECIRHEREDDRALDDWLFAEREIDSRGPAFLEWATVMAVFADPNNNALAVTFEPVVDYESLFRKFPRLIWENCWQSYGLRSRLPRPPYGKINFS